MSFNYSPADNAPIWMQFTPASEENGATEGMVHTDMPNRTVGTETPQASANENETNESAVAENRHEESAGVHVSSVDQVSQLAKREYRRNRIRTEKDRTVLLSFAGSSNTGSESAHEILIRRARQMCFPTIGHQPILTTTTDRCSDAVVVEECGSADSLGSQIERRTSNQRFVMRTAHDEIAIATRLSIVAMQSFRVSSSIPIGRYGRNRNSRCIAQNVVGVRSCLRPCSNDMR